MDYYGLAFPAHELHLNGIAQCVHAFVSDVFLLSKICLGFIYIIL